MTGLVPPYFSFSSSCRAIDVLLTHGSFSSAEVDGDGFDGAGDSR